MSETPKIPKDINDQEITSTGTDVTIYSKTTGRKFVLEELSIWNNSGTVATIELYDGASANGRRKLTVTPADGENPFIDGIYREIEYGDLVLVTDSQPIRISGSGHEE